MNHSLIKSIEDYVKKYVSFEVANISLPIALWIIATHCFQAFDSFAYLVITSKTKRAGKTRLSEVISFAASHPMNFSAMTPSTLFRVINPVPGKYYPEEEPFCPPTIVFDEAESLSSESAGTMRSVLNAGYRKGQTVPRTVGLEVVEFKVFCPKVFILIGDVYDTLRDRSIVIDMKRADAPTRFLYDVAKQEGEEIRTRIKQALIGKRDELESYYRDTRANFLNDREEEIWLPIFALCKLFCADRMRDLQRCAVDISAMKTADKEAYKNLSLFETQSQQAEYAESCARDLLSLMANSKAISSADAVDQLRELDLSPWRTYRGKGIEQHSLADLLASIGIPAVRIRFGKQVLRGYRKEDVAGVVNECSAVALKTTKGVKP